MTVLATTKSSALDTLTKSLSLGSLSALVKAQKKNAVVLLDTSYSMAEPVSFYGGGDKIGELRKVAAHLKESNPDLPFIAFSGSSAWLVNDIPAPKGNTPLTEAIEYAKSLGANHAVVISDGMPNDSYSAMNAAKSFGGQIDTFFIGPDGDYGAEFLKGLAAATGGNSNVTDLSEPKQLASKIIGLLGTGEPEAASAIAL